ncbi:uncharacterized protein BP5553_00928 [Venustampulla echinocandica]|uniref:Uncharacterized protein n=1 Tax=Venustampulla echinocandica TaxID=2656787 RepID=A0A370TZJ4_9HELO|nr:uncharacterized protein BP5553_00928 [Venustampulla echinocandica]RDL40949.1 hypothetical protein BP5553_00928 [Venustampulla echinocandica]
MATISLARVNEFFKWVHLRTPVEQLSSYIPPGIHILLDGHIFYWLYDPSDLTIHILFNANSKITLYWPVQPSTRVVSLTPEGEGRVFIGNDSASMRCIDGVKVAVGEAMVMFTAVKGMAYMDYGNIPAGLVGPLSDIAPSTGSQNPSADAGPTGIDVIRPHLVSEPGSLMLMPMTKSRKYRPDLQ